MVAKTKGPVEADMEYPLANTCFAKLYLPDYSTKEKLRDMLIQAMTGTDYKFDRS